MFLTEKQIRKTKRDKESESVRGRKKRAYETFKYNSLAYNCQN